MAIRNQEIAKILREIGIYLAMQGESGFRIRAYERAAEAMGGLDEEVVEIYRRGGLPAVEAIPSIGVSLAEKIEELIKTSRLRYYDRLRKKIPVNLSELIAVEGVGPRHVYQLYQKLGITNLKELEEAAQTGKICALKGFGLKSEQHILRSIEFLKRAGGRFVLGHVRSQLLAIEERLQKLPVVKHAIVAGSVRRWKETAGDVDFLVTVAGRAKAAAEQVMDFFIHMPEVVEVVAHGPTKSVVRLANGMEADLRVVAEHSYGAALNYFTGSKDHNVALRQRAIERGYKLNEYGLFKKNRQVAGYIEEDLYRALGLSYIEPELREMTGEIEAAFTNKLPQLIGYGELKGDLQVQSDWSDGADSIEAMAKAALAAGLAYIAITDHTKRLAMAGGLDERKVLRQMEEIDQINSKLKSQNSKLTILKGTECDILKDGRLDLSDETLAKLDVVGVSVHSYFNLSRAEQTKRIQRAMENPHVDIVFHPTGRILNRRPAYDLDIEALIETARKTGTVLEVNAYPDRLDLRDDHIRRCIAAGVKLAIDSDAHSVGHFAVLEYGIAQARRGWAEKKDIINAWPLEKMLSLLKDGKKKIH